MDCFVSLLCVVAIAMFLSSRFKVNPSVAPFFTVALITLFMCYTCTLDLLRPAIFLVYGFGIFSIVYLCVLKRGELKENAKRFFVPGVAFFILSSIAFYIALKAENASFEVWDEFSFWGTAAKAVFENGRIYTLFESSMINTSYPPGLPTWSYFMQFFGSVFSEWKVYLAYAVMMMAVVTMLFSRVRWKNAASALVVSFFALAAVYSFWWSFEGMIFYCTSYADYIVGYVFASALLCWFADGATGFSRYLPTVAALMLAPMIKDMGFALALVAAGIIAVDILISGSYPSERVLGKQSKPLRFFVYLAIPFLAVIVSYFIWTLHFGAVNDIPRVEIPYEYSIIDMIKGKDDYFNTIWRLMLEALGVRQLNTIGTIKVMIWAFALPPAVLALLGKSRRNFFRALSFSALMTAGFFAYYFFQAYTYAAIFHHSADYDLVSYGRYISSYAIGWLFAAAGVCVFEVTEPRFKKLSLLPGVAVMALLLAAHFYWAPIHPDQYVFTSPKIDRGPSEIRQLFEDKERTYKASLSADDRIYFVCQKSDGGEWFLFNYQFMPAYTVKTLGGGSFVPMDTAELAMYQVRADKAVFSEYLRENGVKYVFVLKIDDYFKEEFRDMFDDSLIEFLDGASNMYRVVDDGTSMQFVSVYSAEHMKLLNEQYGD